MQPTGVIPSRLLSILRGVQIRGSSLICINIAVLWNTYGHPSPEVIDRIEQMEAEIYYTMFGGQITIREDGRGTIGVQEFLK